MLSPTPDPPHVSKTIHHKSFETAHTQSIHVTSVKEHTPTGPLWSATCTHTLNVKFINVKSVPMVHSIFAKYKNIYFAPTHTTQISTVSNVQ